MRTPYGKRWLRVAPRQHLFALCSHGAQICMAANNDGGWSGSGVIIVRVKGVSPRLTYVRQRRDDGSWSDATHRGRWHTGDYGLRYGRWKGTWRLQSRGPGTVCDCQQTRVKATKNRSCKQLSAKMEVRSMIHPSAALSSRCERESCRPTGPGEL